MTQGIGKDFIEKTKYKNLAKSQQQQGMSQPPLEYPFDPASPIISLPQGDSIKQYSIDLPAVIEKRSTFRNYSSTSLSIPELSFLLWATQGVKAVTNRPVTLRNVPSAGARHAFETYLLINNVDELEPGLYRYLALEHALLPITLNDQICERITEACMDQGHVRKSAVTFIWVAVTERMYWRYGERGYRYLHLDAGHVCQNLYLSAEAIGAGVCAIAAFDDDLFNPALDLDGEALWVVYCAALGKRS